MTLDRNIGLPCIHIGTSARAPADLVAYRVFDFECNEIETFERASDGRDIDSYGEARIEPIVPRQRISSAVNILLIPVTGCCYLPYNAARDAAFEIRPVTHEKIAAELDSTA